MYRSIRLITIILTVFIMFTACSKEENITEKAASEVDQITTKAADKTVKKIKTPINKAKMTKKFGDNRIKAMDEALQKQ